MKANYFCGILLFAILFASCKKEASSSFENENETFTPNIENGRLVFSSHDEFYSYIDDLDKGKVNCPSGFNSLQEELDDIYSNDNIEFLSETKDLEDFNFPSSFCATLNNKGDIQIGDEIIWYHRGKKYFIPIAEENNLADLKRKPESIKRFVFAGSNVIRVQDVTTTSKRIDIGLSGGDARNQFEFNQVYPVTGKRKYVHEVISYFDGVWLPNNVYVWHAYMTLRIKLEYKGKRPSNWRPAGESRNISVSISGDATFSVPGQGGYENGPLISHNSQVQMSGNYVILLSKFNGSGTLPSNAHWSVHLTGTIYQHVVGDISQNAWYNTGTLQSPLW